MTASELTELAARVEAGSGADETLSAEIWTALKGEPMVGGVNITYSVDAVIALIAERLPGAIWELTHNPPIFKASMWASIHEVDAVEAPSAARALLAIFLRAIASRGEARST